MPEPSCQIVFNGLCSFVKEEDEDQNLKQTHVLLVAASRISDLPLDPHKRYLVFNARSLKDKTIKGMAGPRYSCFTGYNHEGKIDGLCLWNIDGYDIDIIPRGYDGEELPRSIKDQTRGVLNLEHFGGGGVRRELVFEEFNEDSLIGSRVRLYHGELHDVEVAGDSPQSSGNVELAGDNRALSHWKMWRPGASEEDEKDLAPAGITPSPAVSLTFTDSPDTQLGFVQIVARKGGAGSPISLELKRPPKETPGSSAEPIFIGVSNLCSPRPNADIEFEHDVLAYYELTNNVPGVDERWIPRNTDLTFPGRTYCPDVFQSLA